MTACDYQPDPLHLALRDRILLYLVDWPANLVRMAVWNAVIRFAPTGPKFFSRS